MLEKPENGGRLRYYVLTLVNEPLPTQFPRLPEHKNPDFVLEKPKNKGSEGQKSTKTSILCSKSLKIGVLAAQSAQKPRFCARNARKWGFRRPKKHKNLDFVLGKTGIGTRKRGK